MSTLPNVRDLLEGHITLELDSIDRLYLNGYVPQLQHGPGLVGFLCQHRGQPIASPALLGQMTARFVAEVKSFATQQAIPLFRFERKESKRLYARLEARVFRPALTVMNAPPIAPSGPLNDALQIIDTELNRLLTQALPTRKAA
jgi:hypothetical protein